MKVFKFMVFAVFMGCFFLTTLPLFPVFVFFPQSTRTLLVKIVSFYSKAFLFVLGFEVNFINDEFVNNSENYLIVSNHLSYLDVLVLSSRFPSCFVTSQEMKETPFLGQIVSLAGCLFVDRKNKSNLKGEINELRDALEAGLNVTVFPEATSTNGDSVIRFRRPLFESSVATGKAILPLTINYHSISNEKISEKNRDLVCWYGDMGFFPHLLKLLEQKRVIVNVTVSPSFTPELLPAIELAIRSHQVISQNFTSLNSNLEVSV